LKMNSVTIVAAVVCAALTLFAPRAYARQNGFATDSCTGCHNGGKEPKVTISTSSKTVSPGDTVRVTIAIEAINGTKGGVYFRATGGTLTMVSGQPTKLASPTEFTHSSPKAAEGGFVNFLVDWKAPATPGGVDFNAWVVSANGDGRPTGDFGGAGFLSFAYGCSGTTYYPDNDNDGFGNSYGAYTINCSKPMAFALLSTDCDDNDEKTFPGAVEVCNRRDDNCDGKVDENLPIQTLCEDNDGDGHGARTSPTMMMGCGPIKGYGLCDGDCNDNDPEVFPTKPEECNNRDDNCDGRVDEGARVVCGVGWCRRYGEGCSVDLCKPGKPRAEQCNAFDDDCDGVDDNDVDCGEGKSCVRGMCVASDGTPTGGTGTTSGTTTGGTGISSTGTGTGTGDTGTGSTPSETGGCSVGTGAGSSPRWRWGAFVGAGLGLLVRRVRRDRKSRQGASVA
jgi:MYXO-CTERM domain-containing protein